MARVAEEPRAGPTTAARTEEGGVESCQRSNGAAALSPGELVGSKTVVERRAVPEPAGQTGRVRDGAVERGVDGRLGPADDHRVSGAGDGGVQQFSGQDAGGRVGEEYCDRVDLRTLALVDRQRVDGVDGVEPGRADLDEPALTLEDGALAAAVAVRRSRRCRR